MRLSHNPEEQRSKILAFLVEEFARKEGRQCVGVELLFTPPNGFRDEQIRKWARADDQEIFESFIHTEKLVSMIIEIAEGDADTKPAGKHRFVVRTHQHLGGRAQHPFALSPAYNGGGEEVALTMGGAGGRPDVIAGHAGQLMRINAQMFESTIRYLSTQQASMREENVELRAENISLRREVDEARSNKLDKEFQIHLANQKEERTNAGFQMVRQLGSVIAAKIGGDAAGSGATTFMMLVGQFGKSLRPDQLSVLTSQAIPMFMATLDMAQRIMFMEIMNTVWSPESGPAAGAPATPLSGANGANGAPSP